MVTVALCRRPAGHCRQLSFLLWLQCNFSLRNKIQLFSACESHHCHPDELVQPDHAEDPQPLQCRRAV
ncbi:hypothetical protein J1605_014345 [Eschrichtius robustus]|uniref:Uncharacterized protein n=1 Tax=Eschrichtius robustus TaxID=9764 RepID=A0AB34GCF6_ESCRO|nr:hypothetical protein J1605_014345 [Eschrichtius robustus]